MHGHSGFFQYYILVCIVELTVWYFIFLCNLINNSNTTDTCMCKCVNYFNVVNFATKMYIEKCLFTVKTKNYLSEFNSL